MSVLENWDKWKEFLGDRVEQAEQVGVNEETLIGFAKKIGDYLSRNVDPKTDQERVLCDLWQSADESERMTLARVMLKLVTAQHNQVQPQA